MTRLFSSSKWTTAYLTVWGKTQKEKQGKEGGDFWALSHSRRGKKTTKKQKTEYVTQTWTAYQHSSVQDRHANYCSTSCILSLWAGNLSYGPDVNTEVANTVCLYYWECMCACPPVLLMSTWLQRPHQTVFMMMRIVGVSISAGWKGRWRWWMSVSLQENQSVRLSCQIQRWVSLRGSTRVWSVWSLTDKCMS